LGQKTHPIGFRLGVIKSWNSKWFSDKNFAGLIYEDMMIKKYIVARLENAGLAKVEILRAPKKVTVDIHTSRPGIVIGRKGAEVDKLREELQLLTKKDISLNIIEVKKPELSAQLVGDSIAHQLEGRISYRRAMKKAISASMKMGAEGIKIVCGGRLAGAEIARTEKYMEGRVPLHTLRADIDYATSTAHTTYGTIGVKVWICRGMVMGAGEMVVKEEIDKSLADRPELDVDRRRERPRGDDKQRRRRPRGRVHRPDRRPDQQSEGAPADASRDRGRPSGGGGPRPGGDRPDSRGGQADSSRDRGRQSGGGGPRPSGDRSDSRSGQRPPEQRSDSRGGQTDASRDRGRQSGGGGPKPSGDRSDSKGGQRPPAERSDSRGGDRRPERGHVPPAQPKGRPETDSKKGPAKPPESKT
jgi:small subunit ribosomal protein S3